MVWARVVAVASFAFTRNWGSVADGAGIEVRFRQGALDRKRITLEEPRLVNSGRMAELSHFRFSGVGTVAPTNRLNRLVPPLELLNRVAGSGGVVLASEMSLASLPGN